MQQDNMQQDNMQQDNMQQDNMQQDNMQQDNMQHAMCSSAAAWQIPQTHTALRSRAPQSFASAWAKAGLCVG
jgi:hypothetical protein